jgi:hypothetical protein
VNEGKRGYVMKQKVKERTEEKPVEDNNCNHYWVIEVANGPTSRGQCKHCGATKEFMNSFPDFNALRKNNNPLDLPKMPDVEVDEESKS